MLFHYPRQRKMAECVEVTPKGLALAATICGIPDVETVRDPRMSDPGQW